MTSPSPGPTAALPVAGNLPATSLHPGALRKHTARSADNTSEPRLTPKPAGTPAFVPTITQHQCSSRLLKPRPRHLDFKHRFHIAIVERTTGRVDGTRFGFGHALSEDPGVVDRSFFMRREDDAPAQEEKNTD